MTTLIGYSQILRSKKQPEEVQVRAASAIFNEAKRLETLSQSLLELMGLADTTPKMRPISVQELFARCGRSLAAEAEKSAAVSFMVDQPIFVMAEAELATSLLRNLVLNAVAATPPSGKVTVTATAGQTKCTLQIADTGCGVTAAELKRICEPFYMVDKARHRREGATGLGLSIASRIAVLHDGALAFTSQQGKGTTVTFTLPLAEVL